MEIPFSIGSKKFLLEPYRTYQEKDILLSASFDIKDFDSVLKILNFRTDEIIDDNEKRVILYKYREISIGDEVDIKFKCDKCSQAQDSTLSIADFIIPSERSDDDVKKLNKEVNDNTLQEFVQINVDDLDIENYEDLKERVKKNQIEFNFIKEAKCIKCGSYKKFDMSSASYIIEIMSDDSLMTLYKIYNHLIFFGQYTKQDIDSMYPFERSIFVGLLNKTKEDLIKK